MALKHHSNHKLRFQQQVDNAANYVLPFIEQSLLIQPGLKVLEIGCGEGGVLKPFFDRGCHCVGVDLDQPRIDLAHEFLGQEMKTGRMLIMNKNVYDDDFKQPYHEFFDLIVLKDVIEHIHNQEAFMPFMKTLLKPGGCIFFGFPPWQMPFGGHQQMNRNKWLSKLPYYHLLPKPLYKFILTKGKGPVNELLEIRDTRISIEKFERIAKQTGYAILYKQHYLFNPIYEYKFNVKAKPQFWFISKIPYLRNYFTTCVYYLIG
ncbi:MAG: class I SAM-dependent methyltransferase [Chitinophagaceae bacterium]|nr:class I SAM-dependent methyltransferase [Chitinophagaceae bacterium]